MFTRTHDLVKSVTAHTESRCSLSLAVVGDKLWPVCGRDKKVLARPLRCRAPLFLFHASVANWFESRVQIVGVGRRFLNLLFLREKLRSIGMTETFCAAEEFVDIEVTLFLVRQRRVVWLLIMKESGPLGEGE